VSDGRRVKKVVRLMTKVMRLMRDLMKMVFLPAVFLFYFYLFLTLAGSLQTDMGYIIVVLILLLSIILSPRFSIFPVR